LTHAVMLCSTPVSPFQPFSRFATGPSFPRFSCYILRFLSRFTPTTPPYQARNALKPNHLTNCHLLIYSSAGAACGACPCILFPRATSLHQQAATLFMRTARQTNDPLVAISCCIVNNLSEQLLTAGECSACWKAESHSRPHERLADPLHACTVRSANGARTLARA